MVNTSQQIGGSLGTALLNTIAATATTTYAAAHTELGKAVMPFAMTHGFTVAFKFSAGLLFVGAIVLLGADPAKARSWWLGEISRIANDQDVALTDLAITPADVAEIVALVNAG